MDEQVIKEKPKPRWLTLVAAGYLVLLCLGFLLIVLILGRDQMAKQNAPTPTPAPISTPYILVRQPSDESAVEYEDFSSNTRDWGLYFPNGKVEVIDGKLILQSNIQTGFVIGTSPKLAPAGEKYYIQADFFTDTDQVSAYGLIFGLNKSLGTFYAFEVWPGSGSFGLLKYNAGKWDELIPFKRHALKPYPEPNTLSVYFDTGEIELYINGDLASNGSDNNYFRSTDVAVFVDRTGYRLIVDNFFTYTEK